MKLGWVACVVIALGASGRPDLRQACAPGRDRRGGRGRMADRARHAFDPAARGDRACRRRARGRGCEYAGVASSVIAILAAAIADLCGPAPAPVAPADPEDAARYVQVADDARAAGDVRVAAVAYRAALARDPSSAAARTALAELCRAA